jgi:hypothetical protein
MARVFVLFFINVLFLSGWQSEGIRADSLSHDEAAIALNIKALHNVKSEVREAAAKALRRIIARYPSGTSNIRSNDSGEAYWMEKVSQVRVGMTRIEVGKILPALLKSAEDITPSGDASYRIDNDWMVMIPYRSSEKVISSPKLAKSELSVGVPPPKNYTGTWTNWYVNGQKVDETQYEKGRYNGLVTVYHDNGQKSYEQHYINHVCDGPDIGWYRDGQKMYSGQYRKEEQDGKWTIWFANGEKRGEENFKDGKFDGLIAWWYENGQMSLEEHYKNGVQVGFAAAWNEQGVLEYRREYKDGKVVEAR